MQGRIDRIENSRLKGWAFDADHPESPLRLHIFHRGQFISEIAADLFREDLLHAGMGNGHHGFDYVVPKSVLDDEESELSVKIAGTSLQLGADGPLIDLRKKLSQVYIRGRGIEIGALHNPLWVAAGVDVQYVDRMKKADLYEHYKELRELDLLEVDIIDNGEELNTIPNDSQDFIIINHFFEHCQNPLGTLRRHLDKLKFGGVWFCTIPDKRCFKDIARENTTFEHFVIDDQVGPHISIDQHYLDWVRYWDEVTDPVQMAAQAKALKAADYSIHFHVWEMSSWLDFITQARVYLGERFEIHAVHLNTSEVITIVRKIA